MKSADNSKNTVAYHQKSFNRKAICTPCGHNKYHSSRRKENRFRTNGIVALTSFKNLAVSIIYDIAPGGVSFFHADEMGVNNSGFTMDILIFDSLTNYEFFISQVKGRVKWKELISDPESNVPTWRFNVEFLDLDSLQQRKLQSLCNMKQTPTVRFLDERLPKISYASKTIEARDPLER